MRVTPDAVAAEHEWVRGRADEMVTLVNAVRADLGDAFGTEVDAITPSQYRAEVDAVFAEGDVAVNAAALVALLRDLDVSGDYPGFVVDEFLGRRLAATIAGGQPLALLAEATFHYADIQTHSEARSGSGTRAATDGRPEGPPDERAGSAATREQGSREPEDAPAGADDLDAALAAGFQTRLPGWDWTEQGSPFGVE
jgi:hypothetical protein